MKTISRRAFVKHGLAASLALAGAGAGAQETPPPERPPNIVLLLSDDHRFDALGCMGNTVIQTPNLDALAAEGVVFDNHFCTTSICCSSRASIFTGLYASGHGVHDFSKSIPPSKLANSYPVLLAEAGYRTGFVGKFGVGEKMPTWIFDSWNGFAGQGQYHNTIDGKDVHLTDLLRDQAVQFIHECTPERPFCLSVSFKAPHAQDGDPRPWQPAERFESLYQDAAIPVPSTATERDYQALPDFLKNSEGRKRWEVRFATPERYQETMRDYYRLITGMDEAIGRIRAALKEKGFDENTLIIYTGDNGFFLGERGLAGKWYAYEPSIRTPLIIRDPRQPAERRGSRIGQMTLNIDLAPTIVMAGRPKDGPRGIWHGRDLAPLINGTDVAWREEWYYEHRFQHPQIPRSEGVRTEKYKYIRWLDTNPVREEIYNLERDPDERTNLAALRTSGRTLEEMRDRCDRLREEAERIPHRALDLALPRRP